MDSLSQAALGAAVAIGVMGRRTGVRKAAALGAIAGTLPDLDVLIDHGDPILNMVLHRAESHALFWLTLLSLPLGWLVAQLAREGSQWRRWWLAMALALLTHPLLDAFTVYGTQLWLPFSSRPVGLGSVFIIDPAYTLPLLVGVCGACAMTWRPWALRLNIAGLAVSTAYLLWSLWAQSHVEAMARTTLAAQGLKADRLLVTPTPFNTVLWRVLAMDEAGDLYHEGFVSLFDARAATRAEQIAFDRFPRGNRLAAELQGHEGAQRIQAFSKGLWAMVERDGQIAIRDLRMGQEPDYVFAFNVAQRRGASEPAALLQPSVAVGRRADPQQALPWLWRRLKGERLAPPR